ncbi:twin-arginine translocase TatA/TatE family subunit [Bacillus sp. FJAT-28004]|uniref:twin-arginine translocase TatA/TatE family subunit n=1 Tax=Bacillus sp. FJAT-28004 TaxID=1679165 RepID=UPI0006B615E7|nr:twin-arginine translocase TatA/TatE family subunit [Bacillus sp. FJAT-28004]
MIGGLGTTGILLLVLVALLLFGPKKLPELGRALGRTISEFRSGTKVLIEEEEADSKTKNETKIARSE